MQDNKIHTERPGRVISTPPYSGKSRVQISLRWQTIVTGFPWFYSLRTLYTGLVYIVIILCAMNHSDKSDTAAF
jgi:hypothetical protein